MYLNRTEPLQEVCVEIDMQAEKVVYKNIVGTKRLPLVGEVSANFCV
jgi:hypothetical protein